MRIEIARRCWVLMALRDLFMGTTVSCSLLNFAFGNVRPNILLLHKRYVLVLNSTFCIVHVEVEIMYQNRYQLRDLHDADILPNTRSRTVSKLYRIRRFLMGLGAKLTGIQYLSNFLTSSVSANQRSGLKNSASSPNTSRLA